MRRRTKLYLLFLFVVCFIVQLPGLLFRAQASPASGTLTPSAAEAGEWQLLPIPPPWYPTPPPGDGNMKMNVIKFDEGGGIIEATIQQSSEACREQDKVEVILFTWTFTAPINRLRPGAMVPVDIKVRLLKGNPACQFAEGHTELVLHPSDGSLSPPFMPSDQVWNRLADLPSGIPRFNFYLQPPGASNGQSAFRISDATPGSTDPKVGWFAFTIHTTSTKAGFQEQYAHFFYKYVFGGAPRRFAIQTSTGNYVTAVNGGGIRGPGALRTDATRIDAWEKFTFIEQGGGRYAIQTANGSFWTAVNGGGVGGPDAIHTDARSVQAWELFALIPLGGDVYAIQTVNGRYLTALNGGGKSTGDIVHTDATSVNGWERFRLIPVT